MKLAPIARIACMAWIAPLAACSLFRSDEKVVPLLDAADPSILHRPFTAEEIRAGMPVGTEIRLRMSQGEQVQTVLWEITGSDPVTLEMRTTPLDAAGAPAGPPSVAKTPFAELVKHATFPAGRSTREEANVGTALGSFDCWIYTVREDNGSSTRYVFAKSLAGPPIYMSNEKDGEVLSEMEQLTRETR